MKFGRKGNAAVLIGDRVSSGLGDMCGSMTGGDQVGGGHASEEEEEACRSEAGGALSGWRGAGRVLRAGGKGQAEVQRWDLVAKTRTPPGRRGNKCSFSPSFETLTVGLAFCVQRCH